ncbi:MAG: hypothetical protein ABL886_10075 [Rhodoglobus sp.]
MADSLEIFEDEIVPPSDHAVPRGIAAVLGLAAVIALTVLLFGAATIGAIVGVVWLETRPAQVDVVGLNQLSCRVTGKEMVVSATVAKGPDFADDFAVGLLGWEPDALYFDSDPTIEEAGIEPGDIVSFSGPAARADEVTGVRMGIWRGEPGYAQTVPMTIEVSDTGCVASSAVTP